MRYAMRGSRLVLTLSLYRANACTTLAAGEGLGSILGLDRSESRVERISLMLRRLAVFE
jgi:hypothetical protein